MLPNLQAAVNALCWASSLGPGNKGQDIENGFSTLHNEGGPDILCMMPCVPHGIPAAESVSTLTGSSTKAAGHIRAYSAKLRHHPQ